MGTRLRHVRLALTWLPRVLWDAERRALLAEMRAFGRALPEALRGPLTEALHRLTPETIHDLRSAIDDVDAIRQLADLSALLDRRSPLGLCLRRSLTRYHFLRRAGLPVVLHFGARFAGGRPDREVTGHAWLTLDGRPYFEDDENWRGFTVMVSFPRG